MWKNFKHSTAYDWVGMFCLFLLIFSGCAVFVIQARWFYRLEISWQQLSEQVYLSKETIYYNYAKLMNYLSFPWVHVLSMPDFPTSKDGLKHFQDVKFLFVAAESLFLVTIVPTFFYLKDLTKNRSWWKLIAPMKIAMLVPLILGIVMSLGFDMFFEMFHELFFTDDTWMFNPATDPVINILPENFFMHCFLLFFVLIEGVFALVWWKGRKNL
ncbi:MAG: TIGR01906 family membrane protein [Lactobacillales bacterium]|jgi:integral membrane protein (TIGR01906 family)|nr:TIGR01906 family membrane protein [Lactobacillales bacterium]